MLGRNKRKHSNQCPIEVNGDTYIALTFLRDNRAQIPQCCGIRFIQSCGLWYIKWKSMAMSLLWLVVGVHKLQCLAMIIKEIDCYSEEDYKKHTK